MLQHEQIKKYYAKQKKPATKCLYVYDEVFKIGKSVVTQSQFIVANSYRMRRKSKKQTKGKSSLAGTAFSSELIQIS